MGNDDSSVQPYLEPSRYGDELSMVRAGLKAIPLFGAAADEAVFGTVEALRQRRFADTLVEVADTVQAIHGLAIGFPEELGNLIGVSAPSLGRAAREEKRTRFRDLLVNAAPLPPGEAAWEGTMMVSRSSARSTRRGWPSWPRSRRTPPIAPP